MCSEQAFCKAAGFEQRVAQQHRVAHALPDRHGNIIPHGDILYQHRIDADADHNKKCLKAQRQQGLPVILLNRFLRVSLSGIALASSPFSVERACQNSWGLGSRTAPPPAPQASLWSAAGGGPAPSGKSSEIP